jgi:hypothetical protein
MSDSSTLTDLDWAEINKLRKAYETRDQEGPQQTYRELGKDPVRYVRVMSAIYPDVVRDALKDAMAKRGLSEQDILDAAQKRESHARDH